MTLFRHCRNHILLPGLLDGCAVPAQLKALTTALQQVRLRNGLIDFVVGKILNQAGIDNDLYRRWGN